MIMGNICSRGCRFCSVTSGVPGLLDQKEPENVAIAIKKWGLNYVVITSVCRDDLEDGGAGHIAKTIEMIRSHCPRTLVEALIPDFRGDEGAISKVVAAGPNVISHNIETVARLSPNVRDTRATYSQSLLVLKKIKDLDSKVYTKSSLMLGLGEQEDEVFDALSDLRSIKVSILTIGQYLQPSSRHLPVVRYITPEMFNWFAQEAKRMGFAYVASGPLVRSSYRAGEFFNRSLGSQ
jgi:lipoic acid synthetase